MRTEKCLDKGTSATKRRPKSMLSEDNDKLPPENPPYSLQFI